MRIPARRSGFSTARLLPAERSRRAAEPPAARCGRPAPTIPLLNLVYVGTGNPTPVLNGKVRPGDNPWTCSIVALNPDTGKLVWGFQVSPHDTHDWDATEVPVLVDADFNGQPRKLLMQASRNGYFFVLDRTNGKNLLTAPFATVNWAKGIDTDGTPHSGSGQRALERRRPDRAQ